MSDGRSNGDQLALASAASDGLSPQTVSSEPKTTSLDSRFHRVENASDAPRGNNSEPVLAHSSPSLNNDKRPHERTTLWLRRADQLLLGFLLISLTILLFAMRWKLSGGFRNEIEIINQQPREFYYSIDINKASWVEWAQLDGIGEKLARRIVENRDQNGPFGSIEDLRRVHGVGPKLLEKLKPFLKCSTAQATVP